MKESIETNQQSSIESREDESVPEKVALIIRHPSTIWVGDFPKLMERAVSEWKDVETYALVDKQGLKLTRLLSEQIINKEFWDDLARQLGLEKGLDLTHKISIETSPIKRAKSEAEVHSRHLRLSATENSNIPLPHYLTEREPQEPKENKNLGEVPWMDNPDEAKELKDEAAQKQRHILDVWFEKYPDKAIANFNAALPDTKALLDDLDKSPHLVNLEYTHRLKSALLFWLIEQKNKKRENLTIKKEDLENLKNYTRKIAYTSISQLRKVGNRWEIHSIGETPHIDKYNEELRQKLIKDGLRGVILEKTYNEQKLSKGTF